MAKQNLGMVTAYAYAMAGGYTGTEAEFEALLGNIATDLEEIENLTVTATTLPEGSSATASYSDGVLTLGIPKGDTGATGAGATATAGTTTTGEPGTDASVVNSGTTKDAVFDFTIPRGDTGNGIESITLTSTVGAVHTYTITFTDGDTTTFEVTDGEVTNDALTAILADYAKTDGAYESMTVGNAEQLISSVYVTDEEPYQFRTSGGSADIGDREFDTLVGGSVAWNQALNSSLFLSTTIADVSFTNNNDGSVTINGTASANGTYSFIYDALPVIKGHKYYVAGCPSGGGGSTYYMGFAGLGVDFGNGGIWNDTLDYSALQFRFDFKAGVSFNQIKMFPMAIDLTQLFGSTIADYIYSLEQGQAGTGVAFFRKYFPKPYYPYDSGTIKSVDGVSAHKTVGFNAWDEEWEVGGYAGATGAEWSTTDRIRSKSTDYIKVVANTSYCIYSETWGSGGGKFFTICFYDSNKDYISFVQPNNGEVFTTPINANYIRFATQPSYGTTYKNDICINLSWDGERNGEYEPYVERSYPLDSSLTLRGIPKIANGKLYYDGDTYESDGTVTRKCGIVDLGTLNWTKYTQATGNIGYYFAVSSASMPFVPKPSPSTTVIANMVCAKYVAMASNDVYYNQVDKSIGIHTNGSLLIEDSAYSDANALKTALNGVYAVIELATPTTESADPYTNLQIVDDFGTEEYVTTSIVPVGHSTKYTNNLKAKLEMSPESPSGDGLYLVQQSSGQNAYVQYISPVPSTPSTDGTYVLKATVSGGTATLAWVAE